MKALPSVILAKIQNTETSMDAYYTLTYNYKYIKLPCLIAVYMLQSIVGTSHYRECLKFLVNTGKTCDHQSLPVLTFLKKFDQNIIIICRSDIVL